MFQLRRHSTSPRTTVRRVLAADLQRFHEPVDINIYWEWRALAFNFRLTRRAVLEGRYAFSADYMLVGTYLREVKGQVNGTNECKDDRNLR